MIRVFNLVLFLAIGMLVSAQAFGTPPEVPTSVTLTGGDAAVCTQDSPTVEPDGNDGETFDLTALLGPDSDRVNQIRVCTEEEEQYCPSHCGCVVSITPRCICPP